MVITVQTIPDRHIYIAVNDRQTEGNRFKPLSAGLPLFVYLDLFDEGLHKLPLLFLVHQLIKLVETDQDLVDVIPGNLFGLKGLLLRPCLYEALLLFVDLVVHPVQTVIQVGLSAVIVTVIRIQLFDLFHFMA